MRHRGGGTVKTRRAEGKNAYTALRQEEWMFAGGRKALFRGYGGFTY